MWRWLPGVRGARPCPAFLAGRARRLPACGPVYAQRPADLASRASGRQPARAHAPLDRVRAPPHAPSDPPGLTTRGRHGRPVGHVVLHRGLPGGRRRQPYRSVRRRLLLCLPGGRQRCRPLKVKRRRQAGAAKRRAARHDAAASVCATRHDASLQPALPGQAPHASPSSSARPVRSLPLRFLAEARPTHIPPPLPLPCALRSAPPAPVPLLSLDPTATPRTAPCAPAYSDPPVARRRALFAFAVGVGVDCRLDLFCDRGHG